MAKPNAVIIDTHIFLWFLGNDLRLSEKATEILLDPNVTVYLSTASIWEIVIKKTIGKLKIPIDLKGAIDASGFTLLSIELVHVLALEQLPEKHKDPFDRILVAQSLAENCPIITTDEKIKKYKVTAIS